MTILYIILGLIVLLAAVLVIRALMFKPRETEAPAVAPTGVDCDKAIDHLAQMVRCKTVSSHDPALQDDREFEKFRELLKKLYPAVHKTCTLERHGKTGLLYRWKGKSDAKPTVLMSHYDVVAVDEASWEKPPFDGIIEDGVLWGRGTLDTKGTLCGVMESAETLIGRGFVPENDIYLSFAGDEEISGDGAPSIVNVLEQRGIRPELVVDEGGAVVENIFPGVKQPCALIGVGEKGMMVLDFAIKSTGGHASAPPRHGPIGKLSRAVWNIESKPFKGQLTPPVAGMFDTLGRYSSFVYRIIFSNLWLFRPVLFKMGTALGAEFNAMMRTTCAFTMTRAGNAYNVLPPDAHVIANLRLLGEDTPQSAMDYLRGVVADSDVVLDLIEGQNPSPASATDTDAYAKVSSAIRQTWPGVVVSPYLMVACSDSRHFCRISDNVMRFSAMELTAEERGLIHAHNERIPVEKIVRTVEFYIRLVQQL